MPKLIKLYITNVAIGFALAVVFVVALIWLDVAHLQHLVLDTPMGWLAGLMMVMFNGIVFAGVQFAIAVMRMAEDDEGPRGGKRQRFTQPVPILAKVKAPVNAARQYRPE